MSVADGIKFIMSLGSVCPAYFSQERTLTADVVWDSKGSVPRRNGKADGNFVFPGLIPRLIVHPELLQDRYEFTKSEGANDLEPIQ
jgi:hypothetical protein